MTERIDIKLPPLPEVETPSEPTAPETPVGPTPTDVSPEARAVANQSRPDGPVATIPTSSGRLTPVGLATATRQTHPAADASRFATAYSIAEIMADPTRALSFAERYVAGESRFYRAARDPSSGLTYDGVNLDARTGEVTEVRPHSAPSKECLDLGVLIKALSGDPRAITLLGAADAGAARDEAVRILGQKLESYRAFHRENPGYGGFLPWFRQGDGTIRPTDDWVGDLPGLDNGEWLWTLLLAEKALRDQGCTELATGYRDLNSLLQENVVKMFFDAEAGMVRADVRVTDPSSSESAYLSIHDEPGRMTYLTKEHGVHEGIMMVLYVTLFGKGLPDGAADEIWNGIDLKRVEHRHGTTWQAFWGSAHESWAFLFLPFRDLPEWRQLFRVREIIRTQNAAARGYPGFGTSTNLPGPDGWTGYLSASGIEEIGSQPVKNNHVYAIYGAFPLLLEHADREVGNVGLAWLLNMLQAPRAQGPWGAGESVTNDGAEISPCKTIDGTLPNLLAMMGGLEQEAAAMLREHGVYRRFVDRVGGEVRAAFGAAPLREPSGFALPTAHVGGAGGFETEAE